MKAMKWTVVPPQRSMRKSSSGSTSGFFEKCSPLKFVFHVAQYYIVLVRKGSKVVGAPLAASRLQSTISRCSRKSFRTRSTMRATSCAGCKSLRLRAAMFVTRMANEDVDKRGRRHTKIEIWKGKVARAAQELRIVARQTSLPFLGVFSLFLIVHATPFLVPEVELIVHTVLPLGPIGQLSQRSGAQEGESSQGQRGDGEGSRRERPFPCGQGPRALRFPVSCSANSYLFRGNACVREVLFKQEGRIRRAFVNAHQSCRNYARKRRAAKRDVLP